MSDKKTDFTRPEHALYPEYKAAEEKILTDFPSLKSNMPFAVGITDAIAKTYVERGEDVKKEYIQQVIRALTMQQEYKARILIAECRYDQHGEPMGEVDEEERREALKYLAKPLLADQKKTEGERFSEIHTRAQKAEVQCTKLQKENTHLKKTVDELIAKVARLEQELTRKNQQVQVVRRGRL